jgi:hypothetical protein
VVTWVDWSGTLGDASGTGIAAQLFDANGGTLGSEFLVNTQTNDYQTLPTVMGLANGGFVVTWEDLSGTLGDASGSGIAAQLFDAGGGKLGSEFLVNTQTANDQSHPTITGLSKGGFVVTWDDWSGTLGDASGTSIKAQRFDAGGGKLGSEFLVNTQTANGQLFPTVAELSHGNFVVTWEDYSGALGPASGGEIKAQLFATQPPAPHDFFATGTSDILWRNTNGDAVIWNVSNLQYAGYTSLGHVDPSWQIAGSVDFTGDGQPDILWRNTYGDTYLWQMNGTVQAGGTDLGVVDPSWSIAATIGANSAGTAEILWHNVSGDTYLWQINGTAHTGSVFLGHVDPSWSIAGTGDFFADGNADILWRNTNGEAYLWQMNGATQIAGFSLGKVDPSWHVAAVADFFGDGHSDILWRNTNGDTYLWQMNGAVQVSGTDLGIVDQSWSIAGTGDYDGTGHQDILWRNSNGSTVVWQMHGAAVTGYGLSNVVGTDWHIAA